MMSTTDGAAGHGVFSVLAPVGAGVGASGSAPIGTY